MIKKASIILTLFLLLSLSACSSNAKVSPEFNKKSGRLIALLPEEVPGTVSREKSQYIRAAVIDRLRSKGFLILEDSLINKVCSDSKCPERKILEEKYLVEGFARLNLESVYSANFVAGIYSTILGDVSITDLQGEEIYSNEYRQSKHGGLLFNTGQVIQGLISQIMGNSDKEFDLLTQKFARGVLRGLPKIEKRGQVDDALEVGIDSINVQAVNKPVYKVCASGSPTSEATLIVNQLRTNLREVSSGRYCGIYRLENEKNDRLIIELRSPFGNSDRKDLLIPMGGSVASKQLNV